MATNVSRTILLTIVVLLAFLLVAVIALMFGLWHIRRTAHADKQGEVTLSTPAVIISTDEAAKSSVELLGI